MISQIQPIYMDLRPSRNALKQFMYGGPFKPTLQGRGTGVRHRGGGAMNPQAPMQSQWANPMGGPWQGNPFGGLGGPAMGLRPGGLARPQGRGFGGVQMR